MQETFGEAIRGVRGVVFFERNAPKDFLRENSHYGDVALIQGDFGAVYQMINFSKSIGLTTVYSTTNRLTEETYENGRTIKKSIFEHVMFREYL